MRTALYQGGPWQPARANAVVRRVNTRALAAVHDILTGGFPPGGGATATVGDSSGEGPSPSAPPSAPASESPSALPLTPDELRVLRWAANSATVSGPSHASRLQYKKATAVEVLVAHLYLTDPPRLYDVMAHLMDRDTQKLWVAGGEGGGVTDSGSEPGSALGTLEASADVDTGAGSSVDDSRDGIAAAGGGAGSQQQQQKAVAPSLLEEDGGGDLSAKPPKPPPRPKVVGFGSGAHGRRGARKKP